jgi:hypothetical protein
LLCQLNRIAIEPDGYCGYRCVYLLLNYGLQRRTKAKAKFLFQDIQRNSFYSNNKFRIFLETYLQKLNGSRKELFDAKIAEATEVNIKLSNVLYV